MGLGGTAHGVASEGAAAWPPKNGIKARKCCSWHTEGFLPKSCDPPKTPTSQQRGKKRIQGHNERVGSFMVCSSIHEKLTLPWETPGPAAPPEAAEGFHVLLHSLLLRAIHTHPHPHSHTSLQEPAGTEIQGNHFQNYQEKLKTPGCKEEHETGEMPQAPSKFIFGCGWLWC